jgi:hypothetical protein
MDHTPAGAEHKPSDIWDIEYQKVSYDLGAQSGICFPIFQPSIEKAVQLFQNFWSTTPSLFQTSFLLIVL